MAVLDIIVSTSNTFTVASPEPVATRRPNQSRGTRKGGGEEGERDEVRILNVVTIF